MNTGETDTIEMKRKSRIGTVISHKMNKTAIVKVVTPKHHPLYKKTIKKISNLKVHDEKNACGEGDVVRIEETRPISREKHWRVAEIITKAEKIEVKPKDILLITGERT